MTIAVVVVAVLVVLLTSLFKLVDFSTTAKQVIALLVSVAAGVLTAWQTGQFDNATDVATVVTVVYGLSQAIYQFVFDTGKPLNVLDQALENVGNKTDGGAE